VFHKNLKSNNAFTLAEVLLVLGIIGIIAAITIPLLIHNYRAKVLHTKLMKANSIISQAAMFMKADDIDLGDAISNKKYEVFESYFKNGNCELPKNAKEAGYKNYSGTRNAYEASAQSLVHPYCLFDGMILWFCEFHWFNSGVLFAVDIDGWKFGSNRYGHDVFFWYYDFDKQAVVALGPGVFSSGENSGYDFYDKCPGKPEAEQGIACTVKAINDENYFKNLPK